MCFNLKEENGLAQKSSMNFVFLQTQRKLNARCLK